MTDIQFDETAFENAFEAALQMEKKDYPAYIGGFQVASGTEFRVWSPIDSSIEYGHFQEPEDGIAKVAVDGSLKTYEEWSKSSVEHRAEIFGKAAELITAQRYRLAAIVAIASGMVPKEAVAEVDRLIEVASSAASDLVSAKGCPTGAWGVISSHNSPLASPAGFALAIMAGGNTVTVIPSKYCPVPLFVFYDLMKKAGLPGGVLNLIADRAEKSKIELADDPRIAGVVVSGSGKEVEDMMFLGVDDELRFVNEIKGMNPILVLKPGNMKDAVRNVIGSAFSFSGQHLYSTSKVIILQDEEQKFVDALIEQLKDLEIDDPIEKGTFTGPMIGEVAGKAFLNLVMENMDCLLWGGKRVEKETTLAGFYVKPAVFSGLDPENELTYMDAGFPVLCITPVPNAEAAFEELSNTECGLSAGILSRDGKLIETFKQECDAPNTFVNGSSLDIKPALGAKVSAFLK